jgi:hypothetical protein
LSAAGTPAERALINGLKSKVWLAAPVTVLTALCFAKNIINWDQGRRMILPFALEMRRALRTSCRIPEGRFGVGAAQGRRRGFDSRKRGKTVGKQRFLAIAEDCI